jgi:hypothetical protein
LLNDFRLPDDDFPQLAQQRSPQLGDALYGLQLLQFRLGHRRSPFQ